VQEIEGLSAENKSNFANFLLPIVWDKPLFDELVSSPKIPKEVSSVKWESPVLGSSVAGTNVPIAFFSDAETAEVQLFRDRKNAGDPWELFIREDVADARAKWSDAQEFRSKGISNSKARWIKVVNRNAAGEILSTKIVSFLVSGIQP
jgi:hypothetical protein